jgi:hypothetical protein
VHQDGTQPFSSEVMESDTRFQSTRLALGSYFAEIVPDYEGAQPVFHWVVQRLGSPEILHLGQEASFAYAVDRTHECLEHLAARTEIRKKQRAVFYEFGELKKQL